MISGKGLWPLKSNVFVGLSFVTLHKTLHRTFAHTALLMQAHLGLGADEIRVQAEDVSHWTSRREPSRG